MSKKEKITPMMEQYLAIKAKHEDAVLFFRLGDFYEMFFDDAKVASEVLGITLTSRGYSKGAKIPLAGFPYHSLDNYLAKMIKGGYRVAICEQMEDPKKTKTVVKRDVTEVVSPGTVMNDDLLESKRNNYLCSIYIIDDTAGIALVDVSTGEFTVDEVPTHFLVEELNKANPSELLFSEEQAGFIEGKIKDDNFFQTKREQWTFSRDYAYETLIKHFGTLSLKGFGCEDLTAGVCAAGAIIHFLREVQKYQLVHITQIRRRLGAEFMSLDSDTRRNLELLKSMRGGTSQGALISVMDKTKTAMGGRLLVQWLLNPLLKEIQVKDRLDAVQELNESEKNLNELRENLGNVGDFERYISKIVTNRASARDLIALKKSLQQLPLLQVNLENIESSQLAQIRDKLDFLEGLVDEIDKAIVEEPPLAITDGGIIRRGYNSELDDLCDISYSGKDWIAQLQRDEREKTGIPSLKVNYNKVFGYYLEVTKANLSKVPEYFIRKQTLVNAERFITPDLKEYEEKILHAEEKIGALEYELFDRIRQKAAAEIKTIQHNSRLISKLDCFAGFAQLAIENKYVRPKINSGSKVVIKDGRHPVVEKLLPYGETFIPNDTLIDNKKEQILILTGPNMAGKSTFLRQVGLIVLMAQMGSFVPVKRAEIGVVDKIFTRVGASDNLAGGESTFLVEMNETANILNNASEKSLILLDEIGRGTSTFDGLSIAWAVAEYLHNHTSVAAKSIFATHYHELTELAMILPRVRNYNVVVKEWADKVVFLRKIEEGGCDHSYGIQVAKLAGLPDMVINRAKEILSNLESDELTPDNTPKLARNSNNSKQPQPKQIDIFEEKEQHLQKEINALNINEMTPLEALTKLNELSKIANNKS